MSDTDEIQLPLPARAPIRTGGGGGGGFLSGRRSSRKVVDGLRTASSRRLNYSSFTSNGSRGGGETEGSAVTIGSGSGSKACTACGIQFTWRMRRHHCRACRKVCYGTDGTCFFPTFVLKPVCIGSVPVADRSGAPTPVPAIWRGEAAGSHSFQDPLG